MLFFKEDRICQHYSIVFSWNFAFLRLPGQFVTFLTYQPSWVLLIGNVSRGGRTKQRESETLKEEKENLG